MFDDTTQAEDSHIDVSDRRTLLSSVVLSPYICTD